LLNWKERRKEERKKNLKITAGKSNIKEKLMIKGECVLTAIRVLKLTDLACSLCNKLFHKKCVPIHHIAHTPEEEEDSYVSHDYSMHILPLTWLWMILNSHNILNNVILVSANNCVPW
jgi:hypothetical protein